MADGKENEKMKSEKKKNGKYFISHSSKVLDSSSSSLFFNIFHSILSFILSIEKHLKIDLTDKDGISYYDVLYI